MNRFFVLVFLVIPLFSVACVSFTTSRSPSLPSVPTTMPIRPVPDFILTSPREGEEFRAGASVVIRWIGFGGDTISLHLGIPKGKGYDTRSVIVPAVSAEQGYYSWVIPQDLPPGEYKIFLFVPGSGQALMDDSDTFFVEKP